MDINYRQFLEGFQADVAALVYTGGDGAMFEDKFTEYVLERLESAGETEGAVVCSYYYPAEPGKDWKINGYCFRDAYTDENKKTYYETLDLFVTQYRNEYDFTVTKDVFTRDLNLIKRFINAAFKGHINYLDPSHELNGLVRTLSREGKAFDRINVFYLSNGVANQQKEKFEIKGLEYQTFYLHVWDISRLYRLSENTGNREPVQINLGEFMNSDGIECLKVPHLNELYECYLAILPGSLLAALYGEYSSRLLESNVRAFLGQNGKFNKGIKETIRDKPEMFLPYNNGISATAATVETMLKEGRMLITRLNDFQIVNGGQTTASLFHTKKNLKEADLDKVFVQMKLTVIRDEREKNEEVPNIARFANSQNKISELDLSSNNAFFVQIQELSRRKYVINPLNRQQQVLWYFERTNGQYREATSRLTPAAEKAFREKNPSANRFVKSDVAKFIHLWEQEPWYVSQGSQRNFIQFIKKITIQINKNILPGENYYKKLIACAIIYRTVDEQFGRKGSNAIGDTNLKSFAVAYTISYFHWLTSNRLDLWKIYEEQIIPDALIRLFRELLEFVYNHLVNAAGQSLISEMVKRESTWTNLKAAGGFDISRFAIDSMLITTEQAAERDTESESENTENELLRVTEITGLGLRFWDGLKLHAVDTPLLKELEFGIWDVLGKIRQRKNLTRGDIRTGTRILEMIESGIIMPDEIRLLSSAEEILQADLKEIYDRILRIKKEEWSRIIDLAEQRKIFAYPELSNIKSVQRAIQNKTRLKEDQLAGAHESLLKLQNKFKINY